VKSFSAVIVIGPTASGKTALAHSLCDAWRATGCVSELVNLDAFQFYKGLDIGTAKPKAHEILDYNYHLVDVLNPENRMDAQEYARRAEAACEDIAGRGGLPVCVGGSGLYLRAFLHGLDELPEADDGIRNVLRIKAKKIGWPGMHRWLQALDPARAQELHPNDSVRIERAIEIFFLTGKPPSETYKRSAVLQEQQCRFHAYVIHVDAPDSVLRSRIEARTPIMLQEGWVGEVEKLYKLYGESLSSFQSMKAIGYRDILEYLKGSSGSEKALETNIAVRTWQYARRQRTWNAKELKHASFVVGDSVETLLESVRRWHDDLRS
jgi:tRNA dimethylallyltransferase